MKRKLSFTDEAAQNLEHLAKSPANAAFLRQVRKTLSFLELNVRHPGLHTHEFDGLVGHSGERIWEAYAQNQTPGAYQVFFHDGPDEIRPNKRIAITTIFAITPHP